MYESSKATPNNGEMECEEGSSPVVCNGVTRYGRMEVDEKCVEKVNMQVDLTAYFRANFGHFS